MTQVDPVTHCHLCNGQRQRIIDLFQLFVGMYLVRSEIDFYIGLLIRSVQFPEALLDAWCTMSLYIGLLR